MLMPADSAIPIFHVVGFSGHRQLADPAAAARAITAALQTLRKEVAGEWIGLSSIATGSDQLFVQQLQNLGMSWHAILPLPRAEFQKDFPPDGWSEVEQALARAEHLRIINPNGAREDAYLDCGLETVDGSDVLVALWNGQAANGKGGTADVVAYAQSIGKPVIIIDADTCDLRRENWNSLARSDSGLGKLNELPAVADGGGRESLQRTRQRLSVSAKMRRRRQPRRAAVPPADRLDRGAARDSHPDRRHDPRLWDAQ